MGRGLGKAQRIILQTLRAIEARQTARNSECADWYWRVSLVINTAHEVCPELQRRHSRLDQQIKEYIADLEERQANGDKKAAIELMLFESIRSWSRRGNLGVGRHKERRDPLFIDSIFNVSRALASLERRGMIERVHGGVRLTEAGRAMPL